MANIKVTIAQAVDLIKDTLKAGLTPMISGSPGIGKSDIVGAIADEYGLKLIDLRLSQCDPTDLSGFPQVSGDKGTYLPMDIFPLEGEILPKGFNGWLLFLDEFPSASRAVQAAAYKLILDHMVGMHKLHPKLVKVCAGNLMTDKAIVNNMSTAMQSRLIHLELTVTLDGFLDWASNNKIDPVIMSYVQYKPDNLHNFNPTHNDCTYACPRTWAFLSKLREQWQEYNYDKLPLIAGTIGEGVAREFLEFSKIYTHLVPIEDLLKYPGTVAVPQEKDLLYALTGVISSNATRQTIGELLKFVERMPIEFQMVTMQNILRKKENTEMADNHPSVIAWIAKNAQEFM
jgi:hypothetical protein